MSAEEIKTIEDARRRIQKAIDDAWPAGMALDESGFNLEIASRLDIVARQYMDQFSELRVMSLDEWLLEHREALSNEERAVGYEILHAYDVDHTAEDHAAPGI